MEACYVQPKYFLLSLNARLTSISLGLHNFSGIKFKPHAAMSVSCSTPGSLITAQNC